VCFHCLLTGKIATHIKAGVASKFSLFSIEMVSRMSRILIEGESLAPKDKVNLDGNARARAANGDPSQRLGEGFALGSKNLSGKWILRSWTR
jgi:hypothetical protein